MVLTAHAVRKSQYLVCYISACGTDGRVFGATPRGEVTLDEQGLFGVFRVPFRCFAGIVDWSVSGAAPVRGVVTLEDSRHICFGSEAVWSRVIIWSIC